MSDLILTVKEADANLVGRKIVSIDVETLRRLGLKHGDYVLIKGQRETVAQIWPARPLENNQKIIRMDSFTRRNAKVNIGDKVLVKRITPKAAKKITFAPTEVMKINSNNYSRLLKKQFLNKPLLAGEEIIFSIFGNPFIFYVQSTLPKGSVFVDDFTQIEILETPISPETGNISKVSYDDIGGLKKEIKLIKEMIELPLTHPELFRKVGIEPPKGILLYGPPGTGKTMLAKAIANEANANFLVINGPSIMSKYVGGAEEKLRQIFKDAEENAPSIIFIDEIDAIAPQRGESGGEVEKRVVAQLLSLMDGLEARGQVIVIAATNRPNAIDPALRRPGRFDREIEIGVPNKEDRLDILKKLTRFMPLDEDIDLDEITNLTHGFVGADLTALVKEAGMQAIRRILPNINLEEDYIPEEILENLKIKQIDFKNALKEVNPSALREVLVEIPNVKWEDIGALDYVKKELKKAVEWPLKKPEAFKKLGIDPIKGILLYGPPGTGKTMLAKAIANETDANFISVKGPELFSKWLGESEKAIREIFHKARQTAPTIVFFDEIDAIATKRNDIGDNNATSRIVNQLLTELDGLTSSKGVIFIAATNRINVLDPALLRPGRIDKIIYIGLPNEKERLDILKTITKNMAVNQESLSKIAKQTEGFSGAELYAIIKEAGLIAIERSIENNIEPELTIEDLEKAMKKINKIKQDENMSYVR